MGRLPGLLPLWDRDSRGASALRFSRLRKERSRPRKPPSPTGPGQVLWELWEVQGHSAAPMRSAPPPEPWGRECQRTCSQRALPGCRWTEEGGEGLGVSSWATSALDKSQLLSAPVQRGPGQCQVHPDWRCPVQPCWITTPVLGHFSQADMPRCLRNWVRVLKET